MRSLRFDGRVTIVTGAARGLGREYALLLASRGAAVVVNDLGCDTSGEGRTTAPVDETVAVIRASGGTAIGNHDAIGNEKSAKSVVRAALESFGRIDILINNAGIIIPKPFEDTGRDSYERHIEVNLYGAASLTRAAWRHLRETKGNVVNVSSHSILGGFALAAYGAAKGAVFALTRTVALEARQQGVRVNAVFPMAATRMAEANDERIADDVRSFIYERLTPASVAPVVAYLAHESCPFNGAAFGAGAKHVAYLYVGETEGIRSASLTPEEVASRIDDITAMDRVHCFSDLEEQTAYRISSAP